MVVRTVESEERSEQNLAAMEEIIPERLEE